MRDVEGGRVKGKGLLILIVIAGIATVGYRWLPPHYNPFVPLTLDDPPGKITQFKLRHLTPQACENLLAQANQRQLIRTQAVADSAGECPLSNVVRVRDFGPVSAFRLANGQRVTVLKGWKAEKTQPWLQALLSASCGYYGNGLGPDYNAAHANHFHLGMRGYGLCR